MRVQGFKVELFRGEGLGILYCICFLRVSAGMVACAACPFPVIGRS